MQLTAPSARIDDPGAHFMGSRKGAAGCRPGAARHGQSKVARGVPSVAGWHGLPDVARAERWNAGARVVLWRLAVCAMVLVGSACTTRSAPVAFPDRFDANSTGSIAVVGDMQPSSWIEFFRERNDRERSLVARHIAEGRPALLVLIGDLVWAGSSDSQWTEFDQVMAPVHARSIPATATPGNHDYLCGGRENLANLYARFPLMRARTYGSTRLGPLGFVLLDSNRSDMGEPGWREQERWLWSELRRLDGDGQVRGVIVLQHHSPYTNSMQTGEDTNVQESFVPAFLAMNKTLVMISGHVHTYERFAIRGKHFLVSGGGGGPRVRLHLTGREVRHKDLSGGASVRPFNVVWMKPGADRVEIVVMGLDKGQDTFRPIDRLIAVYR